MCCSSHTFTNPSPALQILRGVLLNLDEVPRLREVVEAAQAALLDELVGSGGLNAKGNQLNLNLMVPRWKKYRIVDTLKHLPKEVSDSVLTQKLAEVRDGAASLKAKKGTLMDPKWILHIRRQVVVDIMTRLRGRLGSRGGFLTNTLHSYTEHLLVRFRKLQDSAARQRGAAKRRTSARLAEDDDGDDDAADYMAGLKKSAQRAQLKSRCTPRLITKRARSTLTAVLEAAQIMASEAGRSRRDSSGMDLDGDHDDAGKESSGDAQDQQQTSPEELAAQLREDEEVLGRINEFREVSTAVSCLLKRKQAVSVSWLVCVFASEACYAMAAACFHHYIRRSTYFSSTASCLFKMGVQVIGIADITPSGIS